MCPRSEYGGPRASEKGENCWPATATWGCCRMLQMWVLHIPLGIIAAGTALLGGKSKEQTEGALGMIALWRECWRNC